MYVLTNKVTQQLAAVVRKNMEAIYGVVRLVFERLPSLSLCLDRSR